MSKRIPVTLGVILCLALVLSLLPLTGSPVSSRERWEYKVTTINRFPVTERTERIERTITALGASGWELVTVDSQSDGNKAIYLFKRRLPEQ